MKCNNNCLLYSAEKLCDTCAKNISKRIKSIMREQGLDDKNMNEFAFAVLFYKFGIQDMLKIVRESGVVMKRDGELLIHH